MIDLGFVTGNERKVQLKFDQFPRQVHDRLFAAVTAITARLFGMVQGDTPERSGALRDAEKETVYDNPDRIRGRVAVTAPPYGKASALEYGAHGTVGVKAHEMRLDHVFARKLAAPLEVMVSAHDRRLDIAAVRFLRNPLDEIEDDAVAEMRQALDEAASA